MSHETGPIGLKPSVDSSAAISRSLPGISRINNKTKAGAAMVLAGALSLGSACGQVTIEETIIEETVVEGDGCSPVPDCPNPDLAAQGLYENYYDLTGDWRRYDPVTGEQYKVCEPSQRDFCEDGENPQDDGCEPQVCENVKPCDPVPSRKKDGPQRVPDQAGFPISSNAAGSLQWFYNNTTLYPIIYDNTPDCAPGEVPTMGESYYSCDVIPTCEETIPYCDPLPRCEVGESPVVCEDGTGYTYEDECLSETYDSVLVFSHYNLDFYPEVETFCKEEWDPSINEYVYRTSNIIIKCLPTPECKDGEEPSMSSLITPIDCGKWGSWTSQYDNVASCDPIKSCDK